MSGILSTVEFWQRLDRRFLSLMARVAQPLRGVLGATTTASKGPTATMTGRMGETLQDVEVAQHYGFASAPPAGTEVFAIPIGGSSAHLVIVGEMDRAYRIAINAGEVALYNAAGAKVVLKADGTVILNDGTKGVARLDDQVWVGPDTITALAAQMVAAGLVLPGIPPVPPVPPTGVTATISSASAVVRAG